MIFLGKYKILKNYISACDYEYLLDQIDKHIRKNVFFLISPIASQTLVRSYFNNNLKKILSDYDYLVPDSQWVKRAIYFMYKRRILERVYGPELMLRVCGLAQKREYRIGLYGTDNLTLQNLRVRLKRLFPNIKIVVSTPSKFRPLRKREEEEVRKVFYNNRVDIIFISLGSPLEQLFAHKIFYTHKKMFQKSIVVIPFGAAFDLISGVKPQAPKWMQNAGFEWLFRMLSEPRRLWTRYLILGPLFILLVIFQKIQFSFGVKFSSDG